MTCDIVHTIDIKTTPERLYEAITTQKGLAGWWTPQVKAEPTMGALNEFHFVETILKFRVDKLEPARHIAWSSVQVQRTETAKLLVMARRGFIGSISVILNLAISPLAVPSRTHITLSLAWVRRGMR